MCPASCTLPYQKNRKKILSDIKLEISESVSEQYFMKLTEQNHQLLALNTLLILIDTMRIYFCLYL